MQCAYVNVVNSWQLLLFVDYRLNPELQKKCRLDIPKFCKNVLHTQKNDDELQGKVVTCLRKRFIEKVGNSTDVKEHLLKCMYADIKICFLYLFQQCFKTQQNFFYIILQKLSRDCNDVIRNVIKDSAHNYMEDPVLASTCEKEVLVHVYSSSIMLNLLSFIFET